MMMVNMNEVGFGNTFQVFVIMLVGCYSPGWTGFGGPWFCL